MHRLFFMTAACAKGNNPPGVMSKHIIAKIVSLRRLRPKTVERRWLRKRFTRVDRALVQWVLLSPDRLSLNGGAPSFSLDASTTFFLAQTARCTCFTLISNPSFCWQEVQECTLPARVQIRGGRLLLCLQSGARSSVELPCAVFPGRSPCAADPAVELHEDAGGQIQSEGDEDDARWRSFVGFEVR